MSQQLPVQTIFKNRANQIGAFLVKENGDPLPTCGLQSVTLLLTKEDNTLLEKAAATGIAWGYGETYYFYVFNLTDIEANLLKLGASQNARVRIGFSNTTLTFLLKNLVTVEEEPL